MIKAAGALAGAAAMGVDALWAPRASAAPKPILTTLISVSSPAYCSTIKGTTTIAIVAPGVKSVVVNCWKQGPGFGRDSTVGHLSLNAHGEGSVVFHADEYPHGPITVRIVGFNDDKQVVDRCDLQLYNAGGIKWMQGLPEEAPPQTQGMTVVFADDFKRMPSISSTDMSATYYDHKPPNGSQDFSYIPFTGFHSPRNPFFQEDTWLRIRADERKHSTGLLSSMKNNGSGIMAKAPCYFECRFIGPNAIGTWPAFWILSDYMTEYLKTKRLDMPVDELDIIEAYGGNGRGEPNSYDLYRATPHAWNQGAKGAVINREVVSECHDPISMKKFGIPSTWYQASHIYGCKITETITTFYCDNIAVASFKTMPVSQREPFFFLINLATGGGWRTDLSRYGGKADMYVDYVRVWHG